MRLLITGAGGVLGEAVMRAAAARPGLEVLPGDHSRGPYPIELRDAKSVAHSIGSARPDVVLHLAAMTNTLRAEDDPDEAMAINRDGTAAVAAACMRTGARLIALSTDLVFPGRDGGGYREDDAPRTLSVYGASKLAAETAASERCTNTLVVRTSLILARGRGHVAAMVRAIAGGSATLFHDEIRSPILATDLAAALLDLTHHDLTGLLHIAGPQRLTRQELGALLARGFGLDPAGIHAASRLDAPPPPRPGDITLAIDKAVATLGWTPRTIEEGIGELRSGG